LSGVTAMPEAPTAARLKVRYLEEIRPALVGRFGYSSVMQAPRLEKITLNMGVGMAKQDSKVLKAAQDQLATIAGQQPSVRRARKSIAAFKLREGNPVGVAVTLRGDRSYEFLDRLVSIAIPRIRDFRGLNPRSFDGRGNYSMGVREQIIFPEVDYDAVDEVRGLDVTITTTASTDIEAFALLLAMGMPFAAQGRPAGFEPDGSDAGPSGATGPAAGARRRSARRKPEKNATVEQEAPAAEQEAPAADEEAPAADEEAPAAEEQQAPVPAAEQEVPAAEQEVPAAEQEEAPAAEEQEAPAAEQEEAPAAEEQEAPAAEQQEAPAAEQQEAPAAEEDESPQGAQHQTTSDVAEEGTD
jgi:large subunit ribosomal protein L5